MLILLKNNQRGGALLMNVIVGVGIFAMLSLLSIPYLQRYQTSIKLNGVAKNLTADLRLAQQLTITEQSAYLVQFSTSTQDYSILRTGAATTTIKTIAFPAEISYQSISAALNNQVIFNYFGGVSQSGTVVLKNSEDKTTTINIKPSGYIQLVQ